MKRCVLLIIACLLLCNCSGNVTQVGITLYAREDINLGDDPHSRAASLALHAMQTTDLYTARLHTLDIIPDITDKRLAASNMRAESQLYTSFLTNFSSAMLNARPSVASDYEVSIEESDIDIGFSVKTAKGVRYEGRLDYNAAACYVYEYDDGDMQFCKFIGDENGYYIELLRQSDRDGGWYMHRAYFSARKWFSACSRMDGKPDPDHSYHYLPSSFDQFIKDMPPLITRTEYTYGQELLHWDYSHDIELIWDITKPTPAVTASPIISQG